MKLVGEMASRLSSGVEDSEVPVPRIGRARGADVVPTQRWGEPAALDARDRLERAHPELFLG